MAFLIATLSCTMKMDETFYLKKKETRPQKADQCQQVHAVFVLRMLLGPRTEYQVKQEENRLSWTTFFLVL